MPGPDLMLKMVEVLMAKESSLLLGLQETLLVSTVNNQVLAELKYSCFSNWLSLREKF